MVVQREAALVVNTKSRRGQEWFPKVKQLLTEGGINLKLAVASADADEIIRVTREQVQKGVPLVIVGGGDGTLGAVASSFEAKPNVLGVLPLGTGNAFARDLGIVAHPEAAVSAILDGRQVKVDSARIAGITFLNVATVGVSTRIALGLDNSAKRKYGRAVYVMSMVRALAQVRPFQLTLKVDDWAEEFNCLQLVIGNGHYHAGPFSVSPDASLINGKLSVYALASSRRADFVKMSVMLAQGRHLDLETVKSFTGERGSVSAKPIRRITVDGEVRLRTPAEFSVHALALNVMVPQEFEFPGLHI